MRQHVNPFSKNFDEIEKIPSLNEIFDVSELPLHLEEGGFFVIKKVNGKLILEHEFHNFLHFSRVFYPR